jgi:predicted nucleic acid-binding protein
MIFDTDIFIWAQRGNTKAARIMEKAEDRFLSIQTYMELMQCANNKTQHKYVKDFISSFGFVVLPFTENIGHRASIYIEEYTLSSGLRSGDAIIAATAVENNLTLTSSNLKHYRVIKDLSFKSFKP